MGVRAARAEAVFFVCSTTTTALIFVVHVLGGGVLTPRNVFSTVVLINVVQLETTKHLSFAVTSLPKCRVSIARIQRFLEPPELEEGSDVSRRTSCLG